MVSGPNPTPPGRPAPPALERLVAAARGRPGALLGVLEALQNAHPDNYLPAASARDLAALMGVPASQMRSVLTFYSFFNLKPQGRNTLAICRGTACHTRGSRNLLEALKAALSFPPEEDDRSERSCQTTADRQFTVRTVACFGQCALAPVVEVNRTIHGHMNRQKLLSAVIDLCQKQQEGVRA